MSELSAASDHTHHRVHLLMLADRSRSTSCISHSTSGVKLTFHDVKLAPEPKRDAKGESS